MKNSLFFTIANSEVSGTNSGVVIRSGKYKHIVVNHYGGADELRVVEEDRPEPKRGEVRIRVQAAGYMVQKGLVRILMTGFLHLILIL